MRAKVVFLFIIAFVPVVKALAQGDKKAKKIQYKAETLTVGKRGGVKYQKLLNNVVFIQKSTVVHCDSSFYFKKKNVMEAYGHVKIVDDSVTITSGRLVYDGNSGESKLRENVIYTKGEQRLFTDFLDYKPDADIAHYFNGGRLRDSTNRLSSETAFYFTKQENSFFYENVVLVSPDFTLKTDTLRYNTRTKIAYTDGPTIIENEDGTTLFSEGSVFRTIVDQSDFKQGKIQTENYELDGDELYFDDLKRYYRSIDNVVLTAKNKDIIIVGEEGFYDKRRGISKIFGNPVMKRILEADTFYLAADTLVAIESPYDSAERILAYHDIRIFKQGLQGRSDSAAYFLSDSTIFLYTDPILWNGKNQINADTISLYVSEDSIRQMNLYKNSFLTGQDTLLNFNQIKGRDMHAFFKNNHIDYISVNGNAEGIYYVLGEGDSTVMGMNRFICSNMKIGFEKQQMARIAVYVQPEAKFIPPHELTPEQTRLPGYSWQITARPALRDIFHKASPLSEENDSPLEKTSAQPDSKTATEMIVPEEVTRPPDMDIEQVPKNVKKEGGD